MKKKMISIIIVATVVLLGRGFVANNLSTDGNFLRFQTLEFSFGYTSGVCTHREVKPVYKAIGGQAGSSQHNVYEKCKTTNCNYEKFLCTENHTLGTVKYYSSDEAKIRFGSNYSVGSHYYTKCSKECGQGFAQEHTWESILIPEEEAMGYGWPTDVYHYCWSVCAQCKEQKKNDTGVYIATPVMHVFDMGKCFSCSKPQPGYAGTDQCNLTTITNVFNKNGTISFTYKGTKFTIDSTTLKGIMNMIDREIGASIMPQVIAQFQMLLNRRDPDLYGIVTSTNFHKGYAVDGAYDQSGSFDNYADQVKDAIIQVANNSALSQEVAAVIGDSIACAGTGDINNGRHLVDAMKTYPGAVVVEGTILDTTGEYKHYVYIESFPYDTCLECNSYLGKGNYCFGCVKYCCPECKRPLNSDGICNYQH